jgi:hypothetical protein
VGKVIKGLREMDEAGRMTLGRTIVDIDRCYRVKTIVAIHDRY